ncbi:gliding motility-associated-like protein [Salegentibacter sp. 24]|uniref:T9SS type B sorting domain-containing protein n=1 Tax=Salegentibacter sp. 24 TaxID=2183986 RepID=UPI00106074D9|nr:T9SS type B sorting domain-containing protein [Salegentibacter sp. 24]TDN88741.1 gliding motility-associated-like protein [Salegentibacter sp. 24]
MKLLYAFLITILVGSTHLNAQQEAAHWYFGAGAGLYFPEDEEDPISLNNGQLRTLEGSTAISDQNGNLLFYTDGSIVYDRNHNVMQNGGALKGDVSSTQSAIIVPRPAHPGRYYIFTVDKPDYYLTPGDPIEGVNFSEVDMSLNNGNGAIISGEKNIHLITYDPENSLQNEFKSSEKITAVIAGDCTSYWVVTQFMDNFYSFRVSSSGVDRNPVVSNIANNFPPLLDDEEINITSRGYLKISPDGKKIAAAYSGTSLGSPRTGGTKETGKLFIYDFNDETGKVSNEELLLLSTYPYGVEFSAESTKLYVTSNVYGGDDILDESTLYQFDLESSNIINSKKLVDASSNVAGALQLAPNGKIYRAGYPKDGGGYQTHKFLSVINNPENAAPGVGYRHNFVDVSPNDVKLGLPPFVQSLFQNSFQVDDLCSGASTEFHITGEKNYDSVIWDFGDGQTSTTENPQHTFSTPGTYTVSLTKIVSGIPLDPVCKEVTITKLPEISNDFTLTQCDVGDNDPGDGITDFNLQLASQALLEEGSNLQLYFYENQIDAQNDPENQNALENIYRNNVQDQELTVKVIGFNSDCFEIATIKLHTTSSVILQPEAAIGCELSDGEAEFNLQIIEQNIIDELALDNTVNLSFHETETDAQTGQNPLQDTYISEAKTIYIRAENANICYGFGSIDLKLSSFPRIKNLIELQVCTSDFPITLGNDLNITNTENYDFSWNTGENTLSIEVFQAGSYSLKLTDPNLGCGQIIDFVVQEFPNPEILGLEIDNQGQNSDVTLLTNDVEGLSFAIDNPNGQYQESPVFRNIPGGPHTFYAQTNNSCKIAQFQEVIFGFPAFFTPNADGYNDYWLPYETNTPDFQVEYIYIFDRYGKLLKELPRNSSGWNGIYNGKPMPSDDYWFKGKLANGQEFSGHFSLKR